MNKEVVLDYINRIGKVPLCNGRADRAPHICGKCFILCWRCSSASIAFIICTYLFRYINIMDLLYMIIAVVLIMPMGIDGIAQYFFNKESNNIKRVLTGSLFGCGEAILLIQFFGLFSKV